MNSLGLLQIILVVAGDVTDQRHGHLRVAGDQLGGVRDGAFDDLLVGEQGQVLQFGVTAGLRGAQDVALLPDLQVQFGQGETI